MSNIILIVFVVEFIGLAIFGLVKNNPGMFLYGAGGALLNVGIFFMNKT